jgi:hypothetical protein
VGRVQGPGKDDAGSKGIIELCLQFKYAPLVVSLSNHRRALDSSPFDKLRVSGMIKV